MNHIKSTLLAAAGTLALLTGCNQSPAHDADANKATANSKAGNDPIQSATSAAPDAVARNAKVVTIAADGAMTTVREGSNGWTCMPDNPATPGPDPMCLDANSMNWAAAWIGHKPPPADAVGLVYMLSGGTDASNTDPYATKPTAGNNWVKTGPHLMVVGSKQILQGYSSDPKPDTTVPYVMWAGTPYAHLMIPTGQ